MFGDKGIVDQLGVGVNDPGNLLRLPRREQFLGVETPGSSEQSLSPQHLVNSRDTTGELMIGVEDRRVGIGQTGRERQPLGADLVGRVLAAEMMQQLDRPASPHGPLAE